MSSALTFIVVNIETICPRSHCRPWQWKCFILSWQKQAIYVLNSNRQTTPMIATNYAVIRRKKNISVKFLSTNFGPLANIYQWHHMGVVASLIADDSTVCSKTFQANNNKHTPKFRITRPMSTSFDRWFPCPWSSNTISACMPWR